jgi:aminoglycoside phosphotransferase (APT) family kinase protein
LTFSLDNAPPEFEGQLVAKIAPTRGPGEREAIVQGAVAAAGYPAPPVLAGGAGPRVQDGSYMVMPRVAGAPPLGNVDAKALVQALPFLVRRLPRLLASLATHLHRLDPGPLRSQLTARRDWPLDINDLIRDIETAGEASDDAPLARATRSVLRSRPPTGSDVICHGDFHPLNVVIDETGNATVLDWTAARLAPPAFDVSFTALLLANPPIAMEGVVGKPLRAAGRWVSRQFVHHYQSATSQHIDAAELAWFTKLHALRILFDVTEGRVGEHHPFVLLSETARRMVCEP